MYSFDEIKSFDPQIADAITAEMERQNSHIELIASENWVSHAVMAAALPTASPSGLVWVTTAAREADPSILSNWLIFPSVTVAVMSFFFQCKFTKIIAFHKSFL